MKFDLRHMQYCVFAWASYCLGGSLLNFVMFREQACSEMNCVFLAVVCMQPAPKEDVLNRMSHLDIHRESESKEPVSRPRAKRFRRLATLTPEELKTTDKIFIQNLLHSQGNCIAEAPNEVLSNTNSKKNLEGGITSEKGDYCTNYISDHPPEVPLNLHQDNLIGFRRRKATYQQVKRQDGLTHFERTEATQDPLTAFGVVHDVICMEIEDRHEIPLQNRFHDARSNWKDSDRGQTYVENTFLTMVNEYLEEERNHTDHTVLQSSTNKNSSSNDKVVNSEQYVYDIYVETNPLNKKPRGSEGYDKFGGDESEQDEEEWLMEMHAQGNMPFISIVEDDVWLVHEASDAEDSLFDTEDSNAEDYFGNDYPDEEDSYEYDSDAYSSGCCHTTETAWGDDSEWSV